MLHVVCVGGGVWGLLDAWLYRVHTCTCILLKGKDSCNYACKEPRIIFLLVLEPKIEQAMHMYICLLVIKNDKVQCLK